MAYVKNTERKKKKQNTLQSDLKLKLALPTLGETAGIQTLF